MSPPDAERGPGKGPVQVADHDDQHHRNPRGRDWAGLKHSRFACAARSFQDFRCRSCCNCWTFADCEHDDFRDWSYFGEPA